MLRSTALMLAIGRQDEARRLEGAVDRALTDAGPGRRATTRQ
jgi:hypothetical protein